MKLLKFSEFILESKAEILLPTLVTDDFIDKINKIDSPISKDVINLVGKPSNFSYIKTGLSNDTIEYTDSIKMDQYLRKKYYSSVDFIPSDYLTRIIGVNYVPDASDEIWSINRTEIKIGRFIRRVFGTKFSDSEIESFVNQWKSIEESSKFIIWKGPQIKDAYRSNNYFFSENSSNSLMNSCMNDELDLVSFYGFCPTAKILILLNDEDEILGRALFWVDSEGRTIMDRVYYVFDKDYFKFINYAKENGWYYKKNNRSGGSTFVKDGKESTIQSKVRIPDVFKFSNDGFPYMDTFYYAQGEWAMNYEPSEGEYYKLTDTEGGYEQFNSDYEEVD
jgi:hypothetical protein